MITNILGQTPTFGDIENQVLYDVVQRDVVRCSAIFNPTDAIEGHAILLHEYFRKACNLRENNSSSRIRNYGIILDFPVEQHVKRRICWAIYWPFSMLSVLWSDAIVEFFTTALELSAGWSRAWVKDFRTEVENDFEPTTGEVSELAEEAPRM